MLILHNISLQEVSPQGVTTFAESGQQKATGSVLLSDPRDNVTVVTTISAAGLALHPFIVFRGQRLRADWTAGSASPPDARYAVMATDSSFTQDRVFTKYLKDFHQQLRERDLLDSGERHVLVLASRFVSLEAIRLAMSLDIDLIQLPSHATHPLDIAGFGSFEAELTKALTTYPSKHGGALPLKRNMAGVIGEAWKPSFTPELNKAFFAEKGLWPVDEEQASGRVQDTGKKRENRQSDRARIECDVDTAISRDKIEEGLGERALGQLRARGHTIVGLHVSTVMLGGCIRKKQRVREA